MRRNNYVFDKIESFEHDELTNATVGGITSKTGILMLITFFSACASIILLNAMSVGVYVIYALATIATVVLHIIISFNPQKAKALSVPYVICEGIVIGVICDLLELVLPGEGLAIAGFALMLTLGILLGAVLLYKNHRVRVSSTVLKIFLIILVGMSIGILMFMITSLIMFFTSGVNLWALYYASKFSIVVSVLMVIISAFYVYINIQHVDDMVNGGINKTYEWFAAFGLAMSIIWLFLDILRLLIRLAARRND